MLVVEKSGAEFLIPWYMYVYNMHVCVYRYTHICIHIYIHTEIHTFKPELLDVDPVTTSRFLAQSSDLPVT